MTTFYLKAQGRIAEPEARRIDNLGTFDDGWDPPPGNKRQVVPA